MTHGQLATHRTDHTPSLLPAVAGWTRKIVLGSLLGWMLLSEAIISSAQDKIAHPVDSNLSFDRAIFSADFEHVWQTVFKLLSEYQFEFARKDKAAGQLETGYLVFSRNPRFSKLNNGVKAFGTPPKLFLRKWLDGRIKVFAELHQLSDRSTQVIVRPDIQGFASDRLDDTAVSGEWRQLRSNGKFEFEFLNEVATELKKVQAKGAPTSSNEVLSSDPEENPEKEAEKLNQADSNLIFQSNPDGAEIYLNGKLIGMTPSRISLTPGEYQVTLRKPGYKNYQKQFVIFPSSDITIASELEKE